MRLKICGLTNEAQAIALAHLGVHALGFICVPGTQRYVAPDRIRQIVRHLPPFTQTIGVFVDADLETIERVVGETGLGALQLHGQESPAFAERLAERLPTISRIKALRVRQEQDLTKTARYAGCVQAVLLDAYHPQMAGGTGTRFDWRWLADYAPPLPWILSGGLTPENLEQALEMSSPDAIDISSGVEIQPGDKDPGRVAQVMRILFARGVPSHVGTAQTRP